MSNKLYEEALADVRKLTEVAENNAKQAVLNAVVPRIQKLIENELLGNSEDVTADDALSDPESLGLEDSVSAPDDEGKVTLDLDALQVEPGSSDSEFELSMENKNMLKALKSNSSKNKFMNEVKQVETTVAKYRSDKNVTSEQISQMIEKVENMYDYVQESVEAKDKEKLEQKLENIFKDLTNIQENMSKLNRNKLNEDEQLDLDADASGEDVDLDALGSDGDEGADEAGDNELTLKLTGLPDGIDLDGIGVDLVGADDDSGEDVQIGDESGDDDDEVLDLDLGSEGGDDEDSGVQQESRRSRRGDDQLVEIDENMLRAELKRMARLRENSETCDANGNGVDTKAMDDFGGGKDEGEPFLDGEVTTEGAGSVPSSDEGMLEGDDVEMCKESLKRENVLQRRLRSRMVSIKAEAKGKSGRQLVELKARFDKVRGRFNESVKRATSFKKQINESASNSRRSNSVVQRHTDKAVTNLRKKLAESNLQTVKLTYANKVLQSEALNSRQRAQVIRALDECRTEREAKLVYSSIVKRLSASQGNLREGRVIGSTSRPTRAGSSNVVSEGFQTERWAKLAGINK